VDIDQLHADLEQACKTHGIPGVTVGINRGGATLVETVGTGDVDGTWPMRPDGLFRITSMTRPVTAAAVLMLADDGLVDLNEDVTRLLPELAHPRVLRALDGPLDDTVPADREITIHDLLTFRGGFGIILDDPRKYPILQAEADHQLCCAGPPIPVTPHPPEEWIKRLGSLPLMNQPGTRWRYSTASRILGVLIARASGQDLESFFDQRLFGPLGMADTGFTAADPERLVPAKLETSNGIGPYDDGGTWLRPRIFPDGGAGLLSTAADYVKFGRLLADGGAHDGKQLISAELVEQMTTNQLTDQQRAEADIILQSRGWGYSLSIIDPPDDGTIGPKGSVIGPKGSVIGPKGYGWSGGLGTQWLNDPAEDLVGFIGHQVQLGAAVFAFEADVWSAIYGAL
jgi:CubicO group peptidase (beta-lactamase class C family)